MDTSANARVYVGAGNQELLRILWMGFQDGLTYGRIHPLADPALDAGRVVDAATIACERKLQTVEPLDRAVFHPAYTYGWMAGYLATHHDLGGAISGLSLMDSAGRVDEQGRREDKRPITQ